jgi:ribosome-associated protein
MDTAPENTIELAPGVRVPRTLLNVRYARSGGPGGQHVNKVSTKAVLEIRVEDLEPYLGGAGTRRLRRLAGSRLTSDDRLIFESEQHRSQRGNYKECLAKLRDLLIRARTRPRPRTTTLPTRASKERRLDEKKRRGRIKRLRSQRDL